MIKLIFRTKKFIEKNEIPFVIILVFLTLAISVLFYIYPLIGISILCIVSAIALTKTKILKGELTYKLKYPPKINESIIANKNYLHNDSSTHNFSIFKGRSYRVWGLSDGTIYLEDKHKNIFYIDYLEYEDNFFSIRSQRNDKLDRLLE